ncbi:spermidine/putrescine-binding periplasmic protein [Nostoc sp. PCC 7524]|uniref:extracellular solute-binding protein n=1 Tax=Nostoc sp. (strain ATCC 29411 / PCC 7524) TaxID=28072 RepID=UPI00029ECBDD|nr:extracellular solute-binding protein [Nostoc sp. PCC 7524]AFY50633.1 spermidine/putrescine-binding periplasmic protein [Nostoc sp. PCC 7524]
MDRRAFLISVGGLALSQLLVGCNNSKQAKLNVQLLKSSIPAQVVDQFRQNLQQSVQVKFAPVAQLQDIFKQLQTWQQPTAKEDQGWTRLIPFRQSQSSAVANLVTLGDYWLKTVIEQRLIQPLEPAQLKQWTELDARWQQLVRRNDQGFPDPQGKVWAAPYRWGSTVIVYNQDKFKDLGWMPQDWSDLWREEMRSRFSLLDHPREVIGLVLKKLGKSYNTENLDAVPQLEQELRTLNQQAKFYSSNTYLQPLIIGDTWLAVGWSNDVVPILSRYPQMKMIIPRSGTAIWADLWVSPKGANQDDNLSSQWIDFCWQPNIAKQIVVRTKSNSPIPTNIADDDIQGSFASLLLNNQEVFDKSEFLLPLQLTTAKQYESLFNNIKA